MSLKKQLNDLQDQLRRYFIILHVSPNTSAQKFYPEIPYSILLEGMTPNPVSVTESAVKPVSSNPDLKRFNVVLSMFWSRHNTCSNNHSKSWLDIPKINKNSGVLTQIISLEKQVGELQTLLGEKRPSLRLLVFKQLDSSEKEKTLRLAMDLNDLRKELLETRSKLYGLMLGL